MDERFGEMRSLAHSTEPVGPQLWSELLVEVREEEPARYDARWLPYLSRVELPTFTIGPDDEWRELFACLPAGVSVQLMGDWGGEDRFEEFVASEGVEKVDRLDISGLEVGDVGLHELLGMEWVEGVKSLDLRKNGITEASLEVFVRTRWSRLERLVLCDNALNDVAVTLLAERLDAPKLAWLDVSRNSYGGVGAAELRDSERLKGVFVVT